jgi:hypothetical protein
MKIEFDFADENDRKIAEELFDRFSTDYNQYYAAPSSYGSDPIARIIKTRMLGKQMFLYALQNASVINT